MTPSTAGSAFTYSVTTTGTPTPAITLASGSTLPEGVTLTDNGNGTATLAGTSSVAAGTYKFSIQAANGVTPNATQAFTLTVTAKTAPSVPQVHRRPLLCELWLVDLGRIYRQPRPPAPSPR